FFLSGRANVGNYVYNNVWSDQAFYNRLYNSAGYLNNVHAQTEAIDFSVPQYFSDHFIQNASFLRIDNIALSYRLPGLIKAGSMLVASFTVQNPLVITKYQGLDPEVFSGIDGNVYPRPRTFLFGLNFNL
ncbi:MAG: SusC/RagA family protein, partial [Bacteroidetes bacterium]